MPDKEEHILLIRVYVRTQLLFCNDFPNSPLPMKSVIFKLVQKFLQTGGIQDILCRGRPCMVTTAELQDEVREIVEQHVQISLWHLAKHVLISRSSVRWYLRKVGMKLY